MRDYYINDLSWTYYLSWYYQREEDNRIDSLLNAYYNEQPEVRVINNMAESEFYAYNNLLVTPVTSIPSYYISNEVLFQKKYAYYLYVNNTYEGIIFDVSKLDFHQGVLVWDYDTYAFIGDLRHYSTILNITNNRIDMTENNWRDFKQSNVIYPLDIGSTVYLNIRPTYQAQKYDFTKYILFKLANYDGVVFNTINNNLFFQAKSEVNAEYGTKMRFPLPSPPLRCFNNKAETEWNGFISFSDSIRTCYSLNNELGYGRWAGQPIIAELYCNDGEEFIADAHFSTEISIIEETSIYSYNITNENKKPTTSLSLQCRLF